MKLRHSLLLTLLLANPILAMEALDDGELREQKAQDGLSVRLEWRLNADTNGTPLAGSANSIPIKWAGQNEYLIFHKNTGKFVAEEIRFDVTDTPAALGPVVKKALKVTIPGALTFTKWRIDEVSIGDTPNASQGQNGKIVGFETNATFRFGTNTAAYFFDYTPP